ncbi:AsmA family protein [Vibrio sp. 2-Bac 85]
MKLFLKIAAALIVLLLLIVIIVVTFIDPNDYKQQIQDQVKKSVNRDLVIAGDLSWSLYPLLGFQSGQITLFNSPEFKEKTLLNVKETAISISVLPLLKGKLEVGEIILDGVEFNLITNKDGLSNLDNLQPEEATQTVNTPEEEISTEEPSESSAPLDLSQFVLSGLNITNAQLKVIDHQKSEIQEVDINSMTLSEFAFDQTAHFSLNSTLKNAQVEADISLETDLFVDAALSVVELTNLTIESDVLADALSGSALNTKFKSGLKYQVGNKQLDIKAITINNQFSGSFLEGDIYINSSDINIKDLSQLTLGKLIMTSSLTGSSLENNKLETNLQTNLAADINKKTATIDKFELKNKITGEQIQGNVNLSFKQMNVSDFEKIIINQFKMVSELNAPSISKEKINSTISSEINYDLAKQKLNLNKLQTTVNDIELGGELSFIQQAVPVIRYNLKGNVWDLNPYLASSTTTESGNTGEKAPTTEKEVEPDLSSLKTLDIKGDLSIAGVLYQDIKIGKITNNLTVKDGRATLKPLTAKLYDGSLNIDAWVDESGGKNTYKATTSISNITLIQLLKDAAKVDLLSGNASMNLVASGQGLTASKIQQGIVAKGDFKILDGELYGINLSHEIRVLKAKIQGKTIAPDKLVKKTDFASLLGDFTVEKGIANNQKLTMLSPVIRLDGTGIANTIEQTIDYKLGVTPLSKTDESTSYVDLNGISIPLRIKGTFAKPTFALDTEGALKAQIDATKKAVKDKAEQVIKDKAKDILSGKKISKGDLKEEAKDLEKTLKGLFN